MRKTIFRTLAFVPALWPVLAAGLQSDLSPKEILARSVRAHGGDRLTTWKTMTIKGTVDMSDGVNFRAQYLLFADASGKLRVEKDMTVARGGRLFYEYFLNAGVAWSRRNLIPERGNLEEMKRWMNQCYGIAYYAGKAESLIRKEDAAVQWRERTDLQSNNYRIVATRPAYVISATIGKETTDLYIDKDTYYFLQEAAGRSRRVFWDFKKFGDVTLPSRLLEITGSTQREQITPYTYDTVKFNVPIDDWLFTEDMPKSLIGKQKPPEER
jgi:hypothetical protein